MDIFRFLSGLKNRIKDLKGSSPLYLFQLILIFFTISLFHFFRFLKTKLIFVNYPHSFFFVKVRNNWNFWQGFINGYWERKGFIISKKIVKKGDAIIDVGAWIGVYTLFMSKLVGEKGRVYSFEPDPTAMKILKTNININKIKNTKLENLAISSSHGEEIFNLLDKGGTSTSYLKSTKQNRIGIKIKELLIKTTTLDKYCFTNKICPNGIKIDVEGAEALVIKGLSKCIIKYKPWVLLEFHGRFMSDEERILNWQNITERAKKVIFIGGISLYRFGEDITYKTEFLKDDDAVINVLIFY